jgi:hypothetical protein
MVFRMNRIGVIGSPVHPANPVKILFILSIFDLIEVLLTSARSSPDTQTLCYRPKYTAPHPHR